MESQEQQPPMPPEAIPEAYEKTGVFASDAEKTELLEAWKNSPADREGLCKRTHETALAHGLPDFDGWYGLSPDGEFIKPAPTVPPTPPAAA